MSLFNKIIRKVVQSIRVIFYKSLSNCNEISGHPSLNQPLLAVGQGKISFGSKVHIGCSPSPSFYNTYAHFDLRGEKSSILIADDVWINNNSCLIADGANIEIGEGSIIGPNFTAYTSDFHNIGIKKRKHSDYARENVAIGVNVFIGADVTILKGVSIGENSVVGIGSVVTKSFPSNVVIAGNPARIIREL